MAALVPWDDMAKVFFSSMSKDQGRASVDLRIVVGALLVKHIEGISDEDTIQYIQENIYAQYFVGLASFQTKPVFSPYPPSRPHLAWPKRLADLCAKTG